MDSILTSVKKMLGIAESYEQFDADIIMHINSVFMILAQLGVGPKSGFTISDKYGLWSEYISNNLLLESVKSYMYLKVRMLFDPPTSSAVSESIKSLISELEWRINVTVDPGESEASE